MPKPVWENPYEGEQLPIAFKTRIELDETLSLEEQAAIRALGIGIVVEEEIWEKLGKLVWGV